MTSETGWTEVRVCVPEGWGELVASVIAVGPCSSAVVGDLPAPEGREFVRTALVRVDDSDAARRSIRDALAGLAELTGEPELAGLEPEFRALPDEDWANAWRQSWRPFRVGRLCVVTPDWRGQLRAGDRRLALVPGGTFGTGRHATTRRCMQLVQDHVRAGDRVLDVGTGTGILAVTAVLFGAASATGFDIDPASRPAARDLARENGVLERCDFRHGGFEVLGADDRDFDALLANLYSDLIQRHADELAARLRPRGWFAISGCPERHLPATRAAVEAAGLVVREVVRRGRWMTLHGRNRVSPKRRPGKEHASGIPGERRDDGGA
jgi:ribosomal protein L11 methyltransferase